MRTRNILSLFVAALLLGLAAYPHVAAQDFDPRGNPDEPVHLVLALTDEGEANINRMDWDVNAFAPVQPGTAARASDFIEVAGRTTLTILCADLTLIEQHGSEVPRCEPYAPDPAFFYVDDPTWSMTANPVASITVYPPELANTPQDVTPGAYALVTLSGDALDTVTAQAQTIMGLNISPAAKAFALAGLYRSQGMALEALSMLQALPDVQCSARRPSVDASSVSDPLAASPVTYLRMGELYDILGMPDDALRNYICAATRAEETGDPANLALAFARQANLTTDPVRAIELYQQAINAYAGLGAMDDANALLEICGLRNCTLEG